MKNFAAPNLLLKVNWNEKTIEIRLQRDIFCTLFQSSYGNNA